MNDECITIGYPTILEIKYSYCFRLYEICYQICCNLFGMRSKAGKRDEEAVDNCWWLKPKPPTNFQFQNELNSSIKLQKIHTMLHLIS